MIAYTGIKPKECDLTSTRNYEALERGQKGVGRIVLVAGWFVPSFGANQVSFQQTNQWAKWANGSQLGFEHSCPLS